MKNLFFIPVLAFWLLLSLDSSVIAQQKSEHQLSDYLVPVAEADLGAIRKSELAGGYWYTLREFEYQDSTHVGFVLQNTNTGEWKRFEHPVYEYYDTFHTYGDIVYLSSKWFDETISPIHRHRANLLVIEPNNNVWSVFEEEQDYYYIVSIHEIYREDDMLFLGFTYHDGGIYLTSRIGRFYNLNDLSYEQTLYTRNFMSFEGKYHLTRQHYHAPQLNFYQSWGKMEPGTESVETIANHLRGVITKTDVNDTHYILIHSERIRLIVPSTTPGQPYDNYPTNYVGLINRETGEWEDFWEDSWGGEDLTNEQKVNGPVHTFTLDGSKFISADHFPLFTHRKIMAEWSAMILIPKNGLILMAAQMVRFDPFKKLTITCL